MKLIRFRLPALAWLAACLALPSATVLAEADVANGRLLAMGGGKGGVQSACFSCHGIDGTGDSTSAFPRLAGQFAFYLYKQLKDYASGTRTDEIMSPIAKTLSDAEKKDVAAYYASISDVSYLPASIAEPRLIEEGEALSAIGSAERGIQACVNCHGPSGSGFKPAFPYLAGQYASYTQIQLENWQRGLRKNDPIGVMEAIAKRMTKRDIQAVTIYFESVRPKTTEVTQDATQTPLEP